MTNDRRAVFYDLMEEIVMPDPFQSMQGFMGQFQGFMRNPLQFMVQKKLKLPQNINPMQDPNGAIQYLMNSGQMDQKTFNQLRNMADNIENDPRFAQMMGWQHGQQNGQRNPNGAR